MVNGRMLLTNGPIVLTTVCVFGSATWTDFAPRPSMETWLPSSAYRVLCDRLLSTIFVMVSPVMASTTFQCGPSNDGTYRILPSGAIDGRSQPPSGALS